MSILKTFRASDLDNAATAVSERRSSLHAVHVINLTAAVAYLQFYDDATGDVTVGTDAPKLTIQMLANATETIVLPKPIPFATAMTIAATTGADNGTAPGTDLVVNVVYDE